MSVLLAIATATLAALAVFALVLYVAARVHHEAATVKADTTAEAPRPRLRSSWVIDAWERRAAPWLPGRMGRALQRQIVMAGGLEGATPAELFLYALVAGIVGLGLAVWLVLLTSWSPLFVVAGCLAGALYPFLWLRDRVKARHDEVLRALPYSIDLLALCVEAGLDFGAGVARLVEKGKPGPLREEFAAFLAEVRMGKTRAEALEGLGERVGLPALTSFLSALIQADRLGSGLGRTLRLQAEQLRNERSQRAETAAGEAPVKILFPLVLFIFPTIWIILAAPLVFEWLFRGAP